MTGWKVGMDEEEYRVPATAYFENAAGQTAWSVTPQTGNVGTHTSENASSSPFPIEDDVKFLLAEATEVITNSDFTQPQYKIRSGGTESFVSFDVTFPGVFNVFGEIHCRLSTVVEFGNGDINWKPGKGVIVEWITQGALKWSNLPVHSVFKRGSKRLVTLVVDQLVDYGLNTPIIPTVTIRYKINWQGVSGTNWFVHTAWLLYDFKRFRLLSPFGQVTNLSGPNRAKAICDCESGGSRGKEEEPKKKKVNSLKVFTSCFKSSEPC